MSKCWTCGKKTPMFVVFCDKECADKYWSREDRRRYDKEVADNRKNFEDRVVA